MKWYVRENFYIELGVQLLNFYRKVDNIYIAKYQDYKVIEEKILIKGCKVLNSVILSKNGSITIIYTSLRGELILNTLLRDEIVNKVTLMRTEEEYKYMEIASVNNSLNIFYINEVNNVKTLCFRILSNTLTLTPPIIIDAIDTRVEQPYVVSANDSELAVSYIKVGSPSIIGYRSLDFKRNSWSNFNTIDRCSYEIVDMNFLIKGNNVAYSYTYNINRKGYINFGIGQEENIKKNIVEELERINTSSIIVNAENKLNIIYLVGNIVKVKDLELNREVRSVDEIVLKNIIQGKKCIFNSDRDISVGNIIVINSDDSYIVTDSSFIDRVAIQKYQTAIGIPKFITEDVVIDEEELIKKIKDSQYSEGLEEANVVKALVSKIRGYEEVVNNLTQKFMLWDEEKKGFVDNINYLNDQLNKKNHMINSFEHALSERQNLVSTYEKKIQGLSDNLKSKKEFTNNIELNTIKQTLKEVENEKNKYINELGVYKNKIDDLNNIIKSNNEQVNNLKKMLEKFNGQSSSNEAEINSLKNELRLKDSNINDMKEKIQSIQENHKNEMLSLNEALSNSHLENINYIDKIKVLNEKIQELNSIIVNSTQEIAYLKGQVATLEEKNNESFIKKLFKSGE